MQCASCERSLDPTLCVNMCCGTLCLDCFTVDMYTNETASCPTCRKGIPYRSDVPTRLAHAVNDIMRFFQLTPETLPLYNREEINGEKVDLLWIRLNLLKYDKRRVVVLGKRLKAETAEVEKLKRENEAMKAEIDQLKMKTAMRAWSRPTQEDEDVDNESESNNTSDQSSDSYESDQASEIEEMWPDGSIRKVRRLRE